MNLSAMFFEQSRILAGAFQEKSQGHMITDIRLGFSLKNRSPKSSGLPQTTLGISS